MNAALSRDQQALRRQHADERAPVLAEPRQVETLQRGVIPDFVRRRAVRLLPDQVAGVHVVGGDPVVGRLDERQPLHGRDRPAAATAASCSGSATAASATARAAGVATASRRAPPRRRLRRESVPADRPHGQSLTRSPCPTNQRRPGRCRRRTPPCASGCRDDWSRGRTSRPASSRRRGPRAPAASRADRRHRSGPAACTSGRSEIA